MIHTQHGYVDSIYTDYSTLALYDKFYCAKVSHHHYWFNSHDALLVFQKSPEWDNRMITSNPANSKHSNY